MLASTHFNIKRGAADDWFDTILNADTKLFIDPFLVFRERGTRFVNTHQKIITHFQHAFVMIAESNNNPQSIPYRKALHLLRFREPKELCLGYTSKGTRGAGGGLGYAKLIARAIVAAIKRGLTNPKHFEELGILNKGIGADRISDITATIIKAELIAYTQEIAARHKLPVEPQEVFAGAFDEHRLRWEQKEFELPVNPFTGKPLVFVPTRLLRDLPTLNADDWWDSYLNSELRDDVNYDLMRHVDKTTIVKAAQAHPDLRPCVDGIEGKRTTKSLQPR